MRRQFPWAEDYTGVYDRFGLLGPRSLFAHGVHLSERECARLHETGSTVIHCPTSNTFLGSGLFDAGHVGHPARPVRIGVATDVGAARAIPCSIPSAKHTRWRCCAAGSPPRTISSTWRTRGNAMHLGLDEEIGAIEPGRWADVVVLDPEATPVLRARQALSENLEDTLFALAILGDDRAVRATYIAGRRVWDGPPHTR